jgi:hypothetical protein
MSGTVTTSFDTQGEVGSTRRDLLIQHNKLVADLEALRRASSNAAFTSAAIAQATTTTKAKTTATLTYTSKGAFASLAATDNFWTLAGTSLVAGQCCYFVLGVNGSQVASAYQSSIASTLAACVAPTIPDGVAGVGEVTVVTTTTAFVPGTTALATASGTTIAFQNGWDPQSIDLLAAQIGNYQAVAYTI